MEVSQSDILHLELRAISAIFDLNRSQLERVIADAKKIGLATSLVNAATEALVKAPIPGDHGLVRVTQHLPAWIQYLGQRLILLSPRIAIRLLRTSGLHHQAF
jgi:hypothetical protein